MTLKQIRHFSFDSFTNIYGTSVFSHKGKNYLLVSTQKNVKVVEVRDPGIEEFSFTEEYAETVLNDVVPIFPLSKIPDDTEIISLDSIERPNLAPLIGVVFCRTLLASSMQGILRYFNIYGLNSSGNASLNEIGQDVQQFELSFTPFFLTHIIPPLKEEGNKFPYFIISGDDCKLHVYRQMKPNQSFEVLDLLSPFYPFPEIQIQSCVLSIEVKYFGSDKGRILVCGCQNGELIVSLSYNEIQKTKSIKNDVSSEEKGIDSEIEAMENMHFNCWTTMSEYLDGPVCALKINENSVYDQELESSEKNFIMDKIWRNCKKNVEENNFEEQSLKSYFNVKNKFQLVACSSLGNGIIFDDILSWGLKQSIPLPFSDEWDSVLCVYCGDIDLDGKIEIVLGTYGCGMLIYKIEEKSCEDLVSFELIEKRIIEDPIYSIRMLEGKYGLFELAVVSMYGITILRPDFKTAEKKLKTILDDIISIKDLEKLLTSEKDKK